MTKKAEKKAGTKAAVAEQKVVDKIKSGSKAAETKKKDKKVVRSDSTKENKGDGKEKLTGKRTFPEKDGDASKKPNNGASQQPILNRRQKQKVSDLIKKLRISYNKLLMKKKEMSGEEKHAVVQECIDAIGEKYETLCYKHDGCRVLQALIKFGNRPQRILVADKLKDQFSHLMQQKYSHYLASKLYHFAPLDTQKEGFRKLISTGMNKLVLHAFASEVVEYIYTQCDSDKARREMVFSLYGNYSLVLDEVFPEGASENTCALQVFMEKKPQIASTILTKLEPLVAKLVDKGNQRHTFCQAVLLDYVRAQAKVDIEKVRQLAELMKEKMPALLASKEGLKVACALFNLLDAKDRKVVVKSLPVAEMSINRIAHLFLIHVANNLDDTQLTKKKLLHEVLVKIDDNIEDTSFQSVLNSALLPLSVEKKDDGTMQYQSNSFLTVEDLQSMSLFLEKSTSKKDRNMRGKELFKIVKKPLEMFFEERLSYQLLDTKPNKVLRNLFVGLALHLEANGSDLVDEMLRQVQKPFEDCGEQRLLISHPFLHRMLKDMVKAEVTGEAALTAQEKAEHSKPLPFTKTVSKILLKHFEEAIAGRAVFILLQLIETPETSHFVKKQLTAEKRVVKAAVKANPKAKGLMVLLKKIEEA